MWICPACRARLHQDDAGFRCENGHSYDKAKEGYVNLLLAHQKRSKEPGDNKQMINARRAFLEGGFYQPLAHRLAHIIHEHSADGAPLDLFDAGCGEGYYLDVIKQSLVAQGHEVASSGCDIAKVAIQKAAKKYKTSAFCVASTYALPLADESTNALVQVFAPSSETEVHRVLQANGLWLQVNPASNHLHQLKAMIYDAAQDHQKHQQEIDGFSVLLDEELNFDISLPDPQSTLNLLMMTPFYWSASEAQLAEIQENLKQVSAHFHIRVLQKLN
ncbi:methyltransferase domain-containing protein [Alteromonas sp. a30]|nr:methyltransferase domain-containing protein [Alteromonas sp. a30]